MRKYQITKDDILLNENIGETYIIKGYDGKLFNAETYIDFGDDRTEFLGMTRLTTGEVRRIVHYTTGKWYDIEWVEPVKKPKVESEVHKILIEAMTQYEEAGYSSHDSDWQEIVNRIIEGLENKTFALAPHVSLEPLPQLHITID